MRQIVLASSDKAYGDAEKLPYDESIPLCGRHPYDVSKSCADLIAQSYAATYGLPVTITRCGNFYGPGDLNWNRIVPGTIRSVLRGERPVIRSDGQHVRDYFYVENMHGYLCPGCATVQPLFPQTRAVEVGVPCLGAVPFDPALAAACDRGETVRGGDGGITRRALDHVADAIGAALEVR